MSDNDDPGARRYDAAEVLMRARDSLERFIRKSVRNPADAKELAQEVRARFLEASKDGVERGVGYAMRIAQNVVSDHVRTTCQIRRLLGQQVSEELASDVAGEQAELESARTNELLLQALAALDPLQRAMILLVHKDGLSAREAARQLDRSKDKGHRALQEALVSVRIFLKSRERGSR